MRRGQIMGCAIQQIIIWKDQNHSTLLIPTFTVFQLRTKRLPKKGCLHAQGATLEEQ